MLLQTPRPLGGITITWLPTATHPLNWKGQFAVWISQSVRATLPAGTIEGVP